MHDGLLVHQVPSTYPPDAERDCFTGVLESVIGTDGPTQTHKYQNVPESIGLPSRTGQGRRRG